MIISLLMKEFFYLIFAFLSSAAVVYMLLTWLQELPKSASRRRYIHFNEEMPSGLPGMVIFPASLIGGCLAVAVLLENNIADFVVKLSMQLIGAGAILIYLFGLLDDLIGLRHRVRYMLQFVVALSFPCCNLYINNLCGFCGIGELSFFCGSLITVLLVMMIFSALFVLERSSAFCISLPIIVLLVYCGVFFLWELPLFYITCMAVVGALVSFLLFRKINLVAESKSFHIGSSGSLFVATIISYFALKSSMINEHVILSNKEGFAITVALLFLPCADLLRVLLCRLLHKKNTKQNQRLFLYDKLKAMHISGNMASTLQLAYYVVFLMIDAIFIVWEINVTWMVITNIMLFSLVNIWIPNPDFADESHKRKRILFCDNTLWGLVNFRGDVIRYFVSRGYDVYVVAPEKEDKQMRVDIPEKVTFIPIVMGRTSTSPLNDLRYFISLWKIYGWVQPDYCFHYTIKPNIYGSIVASLRGVPTTTAMVAGLGYVFNSRSLSAFVARILYKIGLKFTDYLFVLNEGNRLLILEKGLCTEKKTILLRGGEGIDIHKFPVFPNSPTMPVVFTFVGRVLYDKGYAEFIEAAEIVKVQYPEAKFEIWGSLDPQFPNAVPLHTLQYDVGRNLVAYKGFTQNISDVYNRSGIVVVIPSYHEGMNRTLMEACSTGKPIICSRIHGCMEMVLEGQNGYTVPTRDGQALADAMLRYIRLSEDEKLRMSEMSRSLAESRFTIESVIEEYREIINPK